MLTQNKFSNYLLYGFGEILLVVIGILIALQINNWNENNKNRSAEKEYQKELLKDFEINLKKSNAVVNLIEDILPDLLFC